MVWLAWINEKGQTAARPFRGGRRTELALPSEGRLRTRARGAQFSGGSCSCPCGCAAPSAAAPSPPYVGTNWSSRLQPQESRQRAVTEPVVAEQLSVQAAQWVVAARRGAGRGEWPSVSCVVVCRVVCPLSQR